MSDMALRFGRNDQLSGILSTPAFLPGNGHKLALVMITAGLVHKAGPYRLHTDLCRAAACIGYPALRFDVGGIGESNPRNSTAHAEEAAVADTIEALDALQEELGCRHFILAGLCSGAEVAHRVALQDDRVRGLVALDGYIIRTFRFYLHHYLPRILNWRKWRDWIRSHRDRREDMSVDASGELDGLKFWEELQPGRRTLVSQYQALVERDVQLLQVFSGGSGDCSYRQQFRRAFSDVDFGDRLDVEFYPHSDHMYILRADRQELVRTISNWLIEHFPLQQRAGDPLGRAVRPYPIATTAASLVRRIHQDAGTLARRGTE